MAGSLCRILPPLIGVGRLILPAKMSLNEILSGVALKPWIFFVISLSKRRSVIIGHFQVPEVQLSLRSWMIPARIPCDSVDSTGLESCHMDFATDGLTATDLVASIGAALADGLTGRVSRQPENSLTNQQRGRGQRTNPSPLNMVAPTSRPSRHGEVALRGDLAGKAVHLWFKQLRRLQSYWFAIRANSSSPSAVAHRLELWAAIHRARGFDSSFSVWWSKHSSLTRTLMFLSPFLVGLLGPSLLKPYFVTSNVPSRNLKIGIFVNGALLSSQSMTSPWMLCIKNLGTPKVLLSNFWTIVMNTPLSLSTSVLVIPFWIVKFRWGGFHLDS